MRQSTKRPSFHQGLSHFSTCCAAVVPQNSHVRVRIIRQGTASPRLAVGCIIITPGSRVVPYRTTKSACAGYGAPGGPATVPNGGYACVLLGFPCRSA